MNKLTFIETVVTLAFFSLIFILLVSFETLTNKLPDIFMATIGLLTFVSIFYAIMISESFNKNKKVMEKVKQDHHLKIETLLKEIELAKNDLPQLDKILTNARSDNYKIKSLLDYLNFNKWVFVSVIAYLTSMISYLLPGDYSFMAGLQVISFWGGIFSTFVVVVAWYVINEYVLD